MIVHGKTKLELDTTIAEFVSKARKVAVHEGRISILSNPIKVMGHFF